MLENNPPEIKVDVLTDYEKYIINGKVWYGNDIKYQVTASDIASENKYNSGLESVKTDVLNNSEAFSNIRKHNLIILISARSHLINKKQNISMI